MDVIVQATPDVDELFEELDMDWFDYGFHEKPKGDVLENEIRMLGRSVRGILEKASE